MCVCFVKYKFLGLWLMKMFENRLFLKMKYFFLLFFFKDLIAFALINSNYSILNKDSGFILPDGIRLLFKN